MKTKQTGQSGLSVTFDSDFSEDKQIARRILYDYLYKKDDSETEEAKSTKQLLAERLYEKKDFKYEEFFSRQHPIIDEISQIITELKTSNPSPDEDGIIEPSLDEDGTMRQFIKTEDFKIIFNDFIKNFLSKFEYEKISTDELRYEYQSFFREKNIKFQQKKFQQMAYYLVIDTALPYFQRLVFSEGEEKLTPKELDSLLKTVGRSISQPLINIWQENESMVKNVGSDYIKKILEYFLERNTKKIICAIQSDNLNQHLDEIQNFLFQEIDSEYGKIVKEEYNQFEKGRDLEGEILESKPSEEHPQSTDNLLEQNKSIEITTPTISSFHGEFGNSGPATPFFSALSTPLNEGEQGNQNPTPLFLTPTNEVRHLQPKPSLSPTSGTGLLFKFNTISN